MFSATTLVNGIGFPMDDHRFFKQILLILYVEILTLRGPPG